MSLKSRLLLAAAILAALAGYRLVARHAATPVPAGAAASATGATKSPGSVVTRRLGHIGFSPCTLSTAFGGQSVEALCGSLRVPENRQAPGGRQIALAIAWLPATDEAQPDPVFMLAGGPGQSALESFPGIAPAFAEARKRRDVILVDQRGTGGSNRLSCPKSASDEAEADADGGIAKEREFAIRCATRLAADADVRYYSTSDAIDDLDAVRAAIGAAQINLMGVSYGTRVAQQYAKRYPAHTRTVTLDGVVPNTLVLGNTMAMNLEDSLDRQFARCAADPTCQQRLGDPRANLATLMTRLKAAPPTVDYRDAITGEAKQDKLTPARVAVLARMFAYAPQIAGILPLELHEAVAGRYEPLMALSKLLTGTLGDAITDGMQLSVLCTEDAGELRVDPAAEGSLLGNDLVRVLQAQCAIWPHRPRPADFRQPLTGPVPTLLMSGEFDPVTPPRYGEEVAKALVNGRHLVVRGQGHNVLPAGCMPRLFATFLDRADAKSLDASCLAKVPYAQPFTGFYGWEP